MTYNVSSGMLNLTHSLSHSLDQRSYSTPGPVNTWMGDCVEMGKTPRCITSHPGQLSLAILCGYVQ